MMILNETINEAIKKLGTPVYIYDLDKVRENCVRILQTFRKYYPKTEIHFAVKANSCPAVVREIEKAKINVDCSSPFELLLSKKCGFSKERIMYTGNYESVEDFKYAEELASLINLDDISSLERIKKVKTPEIVSFRINPGIGKGGFEGVVTGGVDAKFGVPYESAEKAYSLAKESGIRRFGIHMMTGSNNLEPWYFAEITDKLMMIAGKVFNKLGITPEYVDIGGGFGIPYSDNEKEIDLDETAKLVVEKFIDANKKFGFGSPALRLEPGRFITGNAGILVTKVTGEKSSYHNYLGVDAGMNSLLRPALYGASHRVETPFAKDGPFSNVDICGRICENSDIFSRNTTLQKLKEDDIVVFKDAGAYGFVMSSNYNGRPLPAEIAISDNKVVYTRKRLSPEEMLDNHFKLYSLDKG